MRCIVTSFHDPAVLAAACRRFGLRPPIEGSVPFGKGEAYGWVVRLNGLHGPLVFQTLTGLVLYHPRDNAFGPYARIMRFLLRCYDVGAALRRTHVEIARRPLTRRARPFVPSAEVA